MATFTENYSLIKPDEADYYDVADMNENMDAIDAAMAAAEQEMDGIGEKIGTEADSGTATLFGQLNGIRSAVAQGGSIIRSIQRVVVELASNNQSTTVGIETVDTGKTIVLVENQLDPNVAFGYSYTLGSSSLAVATHSGYTKDMRLGFWIVEFI